MTRTELKKVVKECLIEILSEDFIKKVINELITDKIKIDVKIPSMFSGEQKSLNVEKQKKPIPENIKEKIRKITSGEDDTVLNENVVEKINDSVFKKMAQETIENEMLKTKSQIDFSEVEKNILNLEKISSIENALKSKGEK